MSPWAPHLAEELWERFGHSESLTYAPWPDVDESALVDDEDAVADLVDFRKYMARKYDGVVFFQRFDEGDH